LEKLKLGLVPSLLLFLGVCVPTLILGVGAFALASFALRTLTCYLRPPMVDMVLMAFKIHTNRLRYIVGCQRERKTYKRRKYLSNNHLLPSDESEIQCG